MMASFIDGHRGDYGVEPICSVLPIAPSTYYDTKAKQDDPSLRSARAQRDDELSVEVERVHEDSKCVYGAHKTWKELGRQGIEIARCTVERLMRAMGRQGVRRGKRLKTTVGDSGADRPTDLVQRDFTAERPNHLWVADFT